MNSFHKAQYAGASAIMGLTLAITLFRTVCCGADNAAL